MHSRSIIRVGQWILRLLLVSWICYGVWNGGRNLLELHALSSSGRMANAQVIGCEPEPAGTANGNVHYAFNIGALAIENHFSIPVSEYKNFPIGRPIPVTYLPMRPHVERIGSVDTKRVLESGLSSFLFLIAGLIAFGLPLLGIQAALSPRPNRLASTTT